MPRIIQNGWVQIALKNEIPDQNIINFLEEKGRNVEIYTRYDEKTVFAKFYQHDHALQLNGYFFDDNLIMLAPFAPCVVVKNLPLLVTAEQVKNKFNELGTVNNVKLMKDFCGQSKQKAMIEFSDVSTASRAVKNCTNVFVSQGSAIMPLIVDHPSRKSDPTPLTEDFNLTWNECNTTKSTCANKIRERIKIYKKDKLNLKKQLAHDIKSIQLSNSDDKKEQNKKGIKIISNEIFRNAPTQVRQKDKISQSNGVDVDCQKIKQIPAVRNETDSKHLKNNSTVDLLSHETKLPPLITTDHINVDLDQSLASETTTTTTITPQSTTDHINVDLDQSLASEATTTTTTITPQSTTDHINVDLDQSLASEATTTTTITPQSTTDHINVDLDQSLASEATTTTTITPQSTTDHINVDLDQSLALEATTTTTTITPQSTTDHINVDLDQSLALEATTTTTITPQSTTDHINVDLDQSLASEATTTTTITPLSTTDHINVDLDQSLASEATTTTTITPLSTLDDQRNKNNDNSLTNPEHDLTEKQLRRSGRKRKQSQKSRENEETEKMPKVKTRRLIKKRRKAINGEPVVDTTQINVDQPTEIIHPEEIRNAEPVVDTTQINVDQPTEIIHPEEIRNAEPVVDTTQINVDQPTEIIHPEEIRNAEPVVDTTLVNVEPTEIIHPEEIRNAADARNLLTHDNHDNNNIRANKRRLSQDIMKNVDTSNKMRAGFVNKKRSVSFRNEEKQDNDNVKNKEDVSDKNKTAGVEIFDIKKQHNIVEIKMSPITKYGVTLQLLQQFENLLSQLNNDKDCKVVLLTTAGLHFSQDLDLSILYNEDKKKIQEFASRLKRFIKSISTFQKPIVAGIQGPATGFWVHLLPFFDMVIASVDSSFTTPYGLIKQIAKDFDITKLSYFFEDTMTNELLLSGNILSAKEAFEAGIISRVLQTKSFHNELILFLQSTSHQIITEIQKLTLDNKLKAELNFKNHLLIQLIDELLSKK